jgi:lipid-A-disaccharide synthase
MRIFISAGEPSGDLHGANFIRTLRRLRPEVEFVGFGGERMEAAGCRLLYPLCQLAVMFLVWALANLHKFLGVLSLADRWFRHQRPDAVVLIDYPGLHWWLARRAHFHGIPVFYFVPPQIWAWLSFRVRNMRRWVDHVLCSLPFEEPWYRDRGVPAHYIGHPYFDELSQQRLDARFIEAQRRRGAPLVALLPGSRTQEVLNNFPTMMRTVQILQPQFPEARFLVAGFKPAHEQRMTEMLRGQNLPIEVYCGHTPEIIALADACVAVSGSVGLELLYQAKPTVVVYRVSSLELWMSQFLKKTRYISLVNLLADRELFPEVLSSRCEAEAVSRHLHGWLTNGESRRRLEQDLIELRTRVGQPGACERAGRYLLDALGQTIPTTRSTAA